jgi:hypothetical protein
VTRKGKSQGRKVGQRRRPIAKRDTSPHRLSVVAGENMKQNDKSEVRGPKSEVQGARCQVFGVKCWIRKSAIANRKSPITNQPTAPGRARLHRPQFPLELNGGRG